MIHNIVLYEVHHWRTWVPDAFVTTTIAEGWLPAILRTTGWIIVTVHCLLYNTVNCGLCRINGGISGEM